MGFERALGHALAQAEAVRDDARAARQLGEEPGRKAPVHLRKEKERHHRRTLEARAEQVLVAQVDAPGQCPAAGGVA